MRIDVQEGHELIPTRSSASTIAKNVINSNRKSECNSLTANSNQGSVIVEDNEHGLEVEVHNMLILDQISFDSK